MNLFYLIATFADDTGLLAVHPDPVIASQHLQRHLSLLHDWFAVWKILLPHALAGPSECRRWTTPPSRRTPPSHLLIAPLGVDCKFAVVTIKKIYLIDSTKVWYNLNCILKCIKQGFVPNLPVLGTGTVVWRIQQR